MQSPAYTVVSRRGNNTSRDVAAALGIAQSTVSRAFTAGGSVSPDLRERIHAMAETMGYRPNVLARSLVSGSSRLIAVMIAPETNLLHPELLFELSRRLAERGYELLLMPVLEPVAVDQVIDRLDAYRVHAVLATGAIDEEVAARIVGKGVPLVTYNRLIAGIPGVSCDFAGGAMTLMRRLHAAGHRRFALVAGPESSWVSGEVEQGVARAAAAMPEAAISVMRFPFRYGSGQPVAAALCSAGRDHPTAILCVNSTVAAGLLDALRYGSHVISPRDTSLNTFLEGGAGMWEGYNLSGLRQSTEEMIEAAIGLLMGARDPGAAIEQCRFAPTLIVGATAS